MNGRARQTTSRTNERRLPIIAIAAKKRVLIVDDSVVVRKALSDILSRDPDLEIAGLAANGRLALAKLQTLQPDIILLDIEMPEMNGLEALPEIRKLQPRVPIIMFSTLTERGASATLDALSRGHRLCHQAQQSERGRHIGKHHAATGSQN